MPEKITENIVEKGVELLLRRNEQLPGQLSKIKNELNLLECKTPKIRDWIVEFEFDNLLDTVLNSSDEYFHKRFPSEKLLDHKERAELAEEIKNHTENCQYCTKIIERSDLLKKEMDNAFEQKAVAHIHKQAMYIQN